MRAAVCNLEAAVAKLAPGTFFCLTARRCDADAVDIYKLKAYTDKSGQAILIGCTKAPGGISVDVIDGHGFAFEVGENTVADVWRRCAGSPQAVSLRAFEGMRAASLKEVRFLACSGVVLEKQILVWPPAPMVATPTADSGSAPGRGPFDAIRVLRRGDAALRAPLPDSDSEDEGAIAGLEASMAVVARRRATRSKKVGLSMGQKIIKRAVALAKRRLAAEGRKRPPPPHDDDDDDEERPSKIASSSSALPSGQSAPAAAASEALAEATPTAACVPVGARAGPREERQMSWGEFSVAPLHRRIDGQKVHIGWGANCWKHTDQGDSGSTRCQKQVTCAPNSSQAELDEARRLAKVWLLMGRDVPSDATSGRTDHLKGIGGSRFRANAPAWSEADCDAMLAK